MMARLPSIEKFVQNAVKAYLKTGLCPLDRCYVGEGKLGQPGGCLQTVLYVEEKNDGNYEPDPDTILRWADEKFGQSVARGMRAGFDGEPKAEALLGEISPEVRDQVLKGYLYGKAARKAVIFN